MIALLFLALLVASVLGERRVTGCDREWLKENGFVNQSGSWYWSTGSDISKNKGSPDYAPDYHPHVHITVVVGKIDFIGITYGEGGRHDIRLVDEGEATGDVIPDWVNNIIAMHGIVAAVEMAMVKFDYWGAPEGMVMNSSPCANPDTCWLDGTTVIPFCMNKRKCCSGCCSSWLGWSKCCTPTLETGVTVGAVSPFHGGEDGCRVNKETCSEDSDCCSGVCRESGVCHTDDTPAKLTGFKSAEGRCAIRKSIEKIKNCDKTCCHSLCNKKGTCNGFESRHKVTANGKRKLICKLFNETPNLGETLELKANRKGKLVLHTAECFAKNK